jgi:ELWxxDGT repeat protein
VNGQELWRTDGTSAGTIMVKDINPGPGGIHGGEYVRRHAVVGDGLYFAADDGVNGQELWRTDGTAAGTTLVADLWPGPSGSKPSDLTLSRGALLFTADDGRLGAELWKIEVPAHTQVMGRGCTLGAVAPELTATPPQLGASLTIAGARAPTGAGVGGVLIISTRVARPVYVGNGCSLFVDLTAPFAEVTFLPDPTGRWSIGVTVPNTAALHGLLLPAQAGIGPTTNGPFGVDLTTGLFLAVRR